MHGLAGDWTGPGGIFLKLSERLQKKGYVVLRFGFRGTPPGGGDFRNMTVDAETQDLREVIKQAKSLGFSDIGVLGESMGGSIALTAHDPSLKVVIFWWPCFDFADTSFKDLLTEESQELLNKQGYLTEDGFKIGKQFIKEIPKINIFDQVENIKCPTLFIHEDNDSEVSHKQSERAFEMIDQPKEIQIIKNAEHCCIDKHDEVVKRTLAFLQKLF